MTKLKLLTGEKSKISTFPVAMQLCGETSNIKSPPPFRENNVSYRYYCVYSIYLFLRKTAAAELQVTFPKVTITLNFLYSIYCVHEDASWPVSDAGRYLTNRKLPGYIFNILPIFTRRWEVVTYIHMTSLP
jgi:hypothetical protein